MKISFLVTYFNQEKFVKDSIESILAINKPCDWEILVGDDGSIDGTVEIVKEYICKYPDSINLFVMPRDNGKTYFPIKRASENRINLLKHATGDYFCTLDGDDFYTDTEFIKDALKILEKHHEVSVVSFGYFNYVNGSLKKTHALPASLGYCPCDKKSYIMHYYIHAGACVHRMPTDKIIKKIESIGYFDDNDILLNSLCYGEMYHINRPVYAYRCDGEGIFTGINRIERSLINTLAYDIDSIIMTKEYKDLLLLRYGWNIIVLFIRRNKIKNALGKEKAKLYSDICNGFENSLCGNVLNYNSLNIQERARLKHIMLTIWESKIRFYIFELKG